jgi:hypothetical protein
LIEADPEIVLPRTNPDKGHSVAYPGSYLHTSSPIGSGSWETCRVASSSTRASADLRGITVAAALRSRPLADGVPEILAGAAGLNKPVRWVHSVEAPRIASLLRGGELLLMTGIGLP